jgi:flagellar hook-length control protein FliK
MSGPATGVGVTEASQGQEVHTLRRIELDSVMKDDGDEAEYAVDDAEIDLTAPQNLQVQGPNQQVVKGAEARKESSASVEPVVESTPIETSVEAIANQAEDGGFEIAARPDGGVSPSRQNLSSDQMNRPLKSEVPAWSPGLEAGAAPVAKDPNGELSIQLTLLRQAFESLRAQSQGQSEAKARSVSPALNAMGGVSGTKATQNDSSPRAMRYLNRAMTARMMERVESALKEAARSRDGKTISLHLEPVQLGRVKVDVSLRDGALHARVTPQSQEVLHALREHSHELQTALRRLGLDVERVTVQVTSESAASTFSNEMGSFGGKSFQERGNNMPQEDSQVAENRFGNEFAGVTTAGSPASPEVPVDHLIA